jgi:hypothetical protein
MIRASCVFVLVALAALAAVLAEPSGRTAIGFTFFGTPLLAIGVALGLLSIWRNRREERR